MKEGGTSLNKTFREYNLVFKGLTSLRVTDAALRQGNSQLITCFVHEIDLREIFECAHLKITVYGRKQALTYVNTLPQCSPASVGLAQARPNNTVWCEN